MYDDTRDGDFTKDLSADELSNDDIVKSLKDDLEKHKNEHRQLKCQVVNLVQENKHLHDKILKKVDTNSIPEKKDDSYAIINKLKSQLKHVNNEKQSLEELWHTSKRTIASLETEIAHYRQQLNHPNSIYVLKQEYLQRIKDLEGNLKEMQSKLDQEKGICTELKRVNAETDTKCNSLENKFKEVLIHKKQIIDKCMKTEINLNNAKQQINVLTKEKLLLECELEKARKAVHDHMTKETEAITKVQEALTLAETALAEKDACIARERESREEVDYLARTIGQVMEEAAKKVDDDIELIKKEHRKEVERLEELLNKTKITLENQYKKTKVSENKSKELEERVKALTKTNMMLDSDLHKASQTIIDLELKIDTLDKAIKKEQEHSRLCEERSKQLQDIVETSKRMKHGWKQMTLDITSKLQAKITELQMHNRKLESENCKLKKSLMGRGSTNKRGAFPSESSSDTNGTSSNNNDEPFS